MAKKFVRINQNTEMIYGLLKYKKIKSFCWTYFYSQQFKLLQIRPIFENRNNFFENEFPIIRKD